MKTNEIINKIIRLERSGMSDTFTGFLVKIPPETLPPFDTTYRMNAGDHPADGDNHPVDDDNHPVDDDRQIENNAMKIPIEENRLLKCLGDLKACDKGFKAKYGRHYTISDLTCLDRKTFIGLFDEIIINMKDGFSCTQLNNLLTDIPAVIDLHNVCMIEGAYEPVYYNENTYINALCYASGLLKDHATRVKSWMNNPYLRSNFNDEFKECMSNIKTVGDTVKIMNAIHVNQPVLTGEQADLLQDLLNSGMKAPLAFEIAIKYKK